MKNQSNILKDLAKYLPEVIIPTLVAFISIPVYTRLFDPTAYGNFNIVRVTNTLLERCSGWIGTSVTRYYNEYEKSGNVTILITTLVKIVMTVGIISIAAALALLSVFKLDYELRIMFYIGVPLFAMGLMSTCLRNIIRMQRRIITHSLFVVTASIFSFLFSLALIIYFKFSIESIFLGQFLISLILMPILWKVSIGKHCIINRKADRQIIRKFASYGIPLTVGLLGGWAIESSDRYMIKWLLGSYEVGVYSACYNITWNSLYLVVNLFYMMEEPLAMKLYIHDGKEALGDFLNQNTRLFLIIFMPLLFMMCCYSDSILSIMVAKKYHAGKGIVGYVAISVLFIGLIFKYRLGMLALEKTKTLMIVIIASGLINIILNMILIPSQGIMGAAIATMISFCIYFLLMLVISKKIFAWTFPMISLLRTTAAAAAVIYPLSMIMETNGNIFRLLTAGVTSLLAYALLLCACNEVKLTEIKSLYELLIAKSKQLKACRVSADR